MTQRPLTSKEGSLSQLRREEEGDRPGCPQAFPALPGPTPHRSARSVERTREASACRRPWGQLGVRVGPTALGAIPWGDAPNYAIELARSGNSNFCHLIEKDRLQIEAAPKNRKEQFAIDREAVVLGVDGVSYFWGRSVPSGDYSQSLAEPTAPSQSSD